MGEAPVTILFTDVEGSTDLFSSRGDAEAQALLRACDDLARQQIAVHGGRVIKSLGDGLMASFPLTDQRGGLCAGHRFGDDRAAPPAARRPGANPYGPPHGHGG